MLRDVAADKPKLASMEMMKPLPLSPSVVVVVPTIIVIVVVGLLLLLLLLMDVRLSTQRIQRMNLPSNMAMIAMASVAMM